MGERMRERAHLENGQIQTTPGDDICHRLGYVVACVATQQVPQSILQSEPVTVALGAEVIENESVVRVVALFEVATMKCDPHEFSLLRFSVLETGHAIAGMDEILTSQHPNFISLLKSRTHLARHEDDKDRPPDIGVHPLFSSHFE